MMRLVAALASLATSPWHGELDRESAPVFPARDTIVREASRSLALHAALTSGALGWLVVASIHFHAYEDGVGLNAYPGELPTDVAHALVQTIPALVSIALLSASVVRAMLRAPVLAVACTAPLSALAGCASAASYFALAGVVGVVSGRLSPTQTTLQIPFIEAIYGSILGIVLGAVFGLAYTPFVARAASELTVPSHRSLAQVRALGALALGIACVGFATLGAWLELDLVSNTAISAPLALVAALSVARSLLAQLTGGALERALLADRHPTLVLVAPELAAETGSALPLRRWTSDARWYAVVRRDARDGVYRERPPALAYVRRCYRGGAMHEPAGPTDADAAAERCLR